MVQDYSIDINKSLCYYSICKIKTKMNERLQTPQPIEQIPGQGQLFPTPEVPAPSLALPAEVAVQRKVTLDDIAANVDPLVDYLRQLRSGEIPANPVENISNQGFFKQRWNSLRDGWQATMEARSTEVLIKKPARLIGSAALFGVYGVAIALATTSERMDKRATFVQALQEKNKQDQLDGYDPYTFPNRVKSKITRKALKLRPRDPINDVLDAFGQHSYQSKEKLNKFRY